MQSQIERERENKRKKGDSKTSKRERAPAKKEEKGRKETLLAKGRSSWQSFNLVALVFLTLKSHLLLVRACVHAAGKRMFEKCSSSCNTYTRTSVRTCIL